MVKHLPNSLSAARLLAAPVLFFLLWRQYWGWALWVIAFAALTDALDGLLARRFGAASRTGEVLDPIADKVLLSGAFLALVLNGSIDLWLAVVVIGRDVLILSMAGGAIARSSSRRFPPSIWGKVSTVFQVLFILALVANLASAVPGSILTILKWTVAALAIISGLDYARRAALPHSPS